jgi:hypothetical protein
VCHFGDGTPSQQQKPTGQEKKKVKENVVETDSIARRYRKREGERGTHKPKTHKKRIYVG